MEKVEECPRKQAIILEILRWTAAGKSIEEIATLVGVSPRRVRRKIDWLKELFGVYKTTLLIHIAHTLGLIYANDKERQDWINSHLDHK